MERVQQYVNRIQPEQVAVLSKMLWKFPQIQLKVVGTIWHFLELVNLIPNST